MKAETTIAIEDDLFEQVKNAAKNFRNPSKVLEKVLPALSPKLKQRSEKQN